MVACRRISMNRSLRLADVELHLSEKMAINTQLASITRHLSDLREPGRWTWPSFDVSFGRDRSQKLMQDELTREVNEHGWSNPLGCSDNSDEY